MRLRALASGVSLCSLLLTSCLTSRALAPVELDFFAKPSADNPWSAKITNWQARHRTDGSVELDFRKDASPLAGSYAGFVSQTRRRVAAEAVEWVQARSRKHYKPDGDYDHWATLGEVMESGADDCDGLDLLTFLLLRKLGFAADEMYRAIVVERGTGQHHMVTLWFERGSEADPYLLDPTGVVTTKLVRLSEVPAWDPIELFDESAHFAVKPRPGFPSVAAGSDAR
jgi:hypothetical protein